MTVCTYDNSATMRRELYKDGEMIASYSFVLLYSKDITSDDFSGKNLRPWKEGKLIGDREAMDKKL